MAGLAAASVAAVTALVFLLVVLFPGLRYTPTHPASPAPTRAAPAAAVASFTAAASAPAVKVVDSLLAAQPAGLPGGLGAASSVTGTVSPALALSCDRPVAPVISHQRSWGAQSGALGSGITVTASAYSAGAGAEAMRAMREARAECRRGIDVAPRDGAGVEALSTVATVAGTPVRSVVLRRGDVLVSVTGVRMAVPDELVGDLDHRLDALLAAPGVCPNQQASAGDFARSLVAGNAYAGFEGTSAVPYPSTGGLPTTVVPSAPISLDAPVTATTPAEPYWPSSAPAPLASPTAPVPPSVYPTVTSIATPQADTVGPGCGWSFTGMHAPTFDDAAAQRTTSERAQAAVAAMQKAIDAYPDQALAYAAAWSAFEEQAASYAETNAQIAQVEATWAIIRQQQADYATALARYQADLKSYTDFSAEQAAALTAYQQALAECASVSAVLPPVATTPSDAGGGGRASSPRPATPTTPSISSPSPAGTDSSLAPARMGAAPAHCPPVADPILTATPPISPVSPVPPPDPRPTPMPGGTQ